MPDVYAVYNSQSVQVCQCGSLEDAIMMVKFEEGRTFRKLRFLKDQVIDVTATVDGQLPGQLGLPKGTDQVSGSQQEVLPQNESVPFTV